MAAKYRKVDPRIWHDENFRTLSAEDKLLAIYCLTSPQSNRIGIFYFSLALAADQLRTTKDALAMGMARVCDTLSWSFDSASEVLFLPRWWKYNGKCGAKTMKGNLDDLHDVPQSPLIKEFLSNRRYLSEQESSCLRRVSDGYGMGIGYPSHQEQEQEQDNKPPISPLNKTDEDNHANNGKPRKRFKPPTVDEVRAYCQERDNGIDPEAFHDFYEANGWVQGSSGKKLKDWKAAVRTWEKRNPRRSRVATPEEMANWTPE